MVVCVKPRSTSADRALLQRGQAVVGLWRPDEAVICALDSWGQQRSGRYNVRAGVFRVSPRANCFCILKHVGDDVRYVKRGDPGIEPGTSRTLSGNHTTRPIARSYTPPPHPFKPYILQPPSIKYSLSTPHHDRVYSWVGSLQIIRLAAKPCPKSTPLY